MKYILTLMLITAHVPAFAFDDNEDCDAGSGSTYSQACFASKEANKADKQLNAKYQQILRIYKKAKADKEIKLLVEAQRAWIRYRDKVCDFENQAFGGINSISWVRCKARITTARLSELNEFGSE